MKIILLMWRGTRDIDGDWIGEAPTMEQIENALRNAVKKVDASLDIETKRIFGEKKSAGFTIINYEREKIASIDLSVRENHYSKPYISHINGIAIEGASLTKMLSDKLYAVSSESICRRVKDLLDIYVMSYVAEFNAKDIYEIWEQTGRKPGNFNEFRNQMKEIADAYEKLKGIKNKPDFIELYTRLSGFLIPFYDHTIIEPLNWRFGEWADISQEDKVRDKRR